MKFFKIDDNSHLVAKNEAKRLGMTLQGFLKMIIAEYIANKKG